MWPIVIAALAQTGSTDRWVSVGNFVGQQVHLDSLTLQEAGPVRRYWVRHTYDKPEDGTKTTLYKERLNCEERTVAPEAFVHRSATGAVLDTGTLSSAVAQPQPIEPDTMREMIYFMVCK